MTPRRAVLIRRSTRAVAAAVLFGSALAAALPARAGVEEGRAKAQMCVACHGAGGNSAAAGIPSLSAQPQQFLVSALFQFREGKRVNPIMTPIAATLTNGDLNDLAAYFSAQAAPAPAPASAPVSAPTIQAGRRLTQENNCVACHAANLMGQQHIPRIAGQQVDYLRDQLRAFKATTRADMDGTMTSAAQVLTEETIEILAKYLAGLTPAP